MGIICYFVLSFCFKFVFQIFWPGKYVFIGVASGVVGQFVILDSIYIFWKIYWKSFKTFKQN